MVRELALFSGGGGGLLGSVLSGFHTVCAVEIDPKARGRVLRRQAEGCLPVFPIWDDVATFDGRPWRDEVDVITGGFPCTDISRAGRGVGITGECSGLFFEMLRIIEEVRPRFVLAENAKELRTRGLGAVIEGLTRLGYVGRHGVLGARHVGANHWRKRMWVVAELAMPTPNTSSKRGGKRCVSGRTKASVTDAKSHCDEQRDSWWGFPRFAGVDDGDPNRLDLERAVAEMEMAGVAEEPRDRNARIRITGNMQVPAVAALAWEVLR